MSTAARPTPTTPPATPLSSARPRTAAAPSAATRTVRYALHTTRMTLTNVMFMLFTIAMPVGMYLLFGMMFGEQGGGDARGIIMVNMAAYGGLGAAVTAGTQIQEDQRGGFLRQLVVAGLSPRSFLVGSVMAASAVIVPALVAVCVVGVVSGVEVRAACTDSDAALAALFTGPLAGQVHEVLVAAPGLEEAFLRITDHTPERGHDR